MLLPLRSSNAQLEQTLRDPFCKGTKSGENMQSLWDSIGHKEPAWVAGLASFVGAFATLHELLFGAFVGTLHAFVGAFVGTLHAFVGAFVGTLHAFAGAFVGTLHAFAGAFVGAFVGTLHAFAGAFVGTLHAFAGAFVGAQDATALEAGLHELSAILHVFLFLEFIFSSEFGLLVQTFSCLFQLYPKSLAHPFTSMRPCASGGCNHGITQSKPFHAYPLDGTHPYWSFVPCKLLGCL